MVVERTSWNSIVLSLITHLESIGEEHSCIFAGHVAIRAFKELWDLHAIAVATNVRICNPLLLSRLQSLSSPSPAEVERVVNMEGSVQVLIDPKASAAGRWHRHLVVIVPNQFGQQDALLDLTVSQFENHQADIHLQAVLAPVAGGFRKCSLRAQIPVKQSLVAYTSFPEDRSFESSEAWMWDRAHEHVLECVVADCKPA